MLGKIIEFLRKIGVIQAGASSYAGDASQRPLSMSGNDVDLKQIERENRDKIK